MWDRAGMSHRNSLLGHAALSMGRAAAVLWVMLITMGLAQAADPQKCLTPEQRRSSVASGHALPLARALRPVRHRLHGEVVRARLCESNRGLVYMLTVLARDGKVTSAAVDALHGKLLGGP